MHDVPHIHLEMAYTLPRETNSRPTAGKCNGERAVDYYRLVSSLKETGEELILSAFHWLWYENQTFVATLPNTYRTLPWYFSLASSFTNPNFLNHLTEPRYMFALVLIPSTAP